MTDPLPTFTIGVGQAGIAIMNTLAETAERNGSEEFFDFLAIDTDGDTLGTVPSGTKRIRLNVSDAHLEEDRATYPYLTGETEIGSKGAERQRPVGRYKLDSRGNETFDDYFEEIWYEILEHHQEVDYTFRPDRDSYNIFLLHSLGGGTGSGTFPLLAAMVNRIAQRIDDQSPEVDVYVAGVGVVPQVDFDPAVTDPPGDQMYYPNAYAALNDLSRLLDADEESLELPIYSKTFGRGGQHSDVEDRVQESFAGNAIPIDRNPFNDYWLVGVDERLITSGTGTTWIEGYREQTNRRVAESIYALSEMEQSVENWSSRAKGIASLGTVGHAKLTVPYEQIREFCQMKEDREAERELAESVIPARLSSLAEEKEFLEAVKVDPAVLVDQLEEGPERERSLRGLLESELGAGNALVRNSSAEALERVLDRVEAEYRGGDSTPDTTAEDEELPGAADFGIDRRAEYLLLATAVLDEMLSDPNAAPAVDKHWEEVVSEQWRRYDMASRTKFGGAATTTLSGKAEALKTFHQEKIDEFETELENVDLDFIGQLKDRVPSPAPLIHPHLESDRQAAERKVETLRDSRDDLLEADGRYRRVQAMKETVRDRRNRAKNLLDDKVGRVNSRITELEARREEAEARIEELGRSIEQEKHELGSERTGKRLGIFPLRRDKLDELTLRRLDEELTSLDAFVTQGFIDERKVRDGIDTWLDNATSWNDPVFDLDYSGTERSETDNRRQELWLLYHEANEEYAVEGIDTMVGGDTRRSGSDNTIDYIGDPYSLLFVSFYNRGPPEALTLYQRLEEMADRGQLDAMAGKYHDYRQSFAYPEWYDRDVQLAFHITSRVTIPRPPELDLDRIDKPGMNPGEKKNYVKQTGLDTYLWRGTMWSDYRFDEDDEVFEGWNTQLEGLTFTSLQKSTADADLKSQWLAGQADWDDVLEDYRQNLEDREQLQVTFE